MPMLGTFPPVPQLPQCGRPWRYLIRCLLRIKPPKSRSTGLRCGYRSQLQNCFNADGPQSTGLKDALMKFGYPVGNSAMEATNEETVSYVRKKAMEKNTLMC